MINKEALKLQTDLDKQFYLKKTPMKTYQNERLIDERRFTIAEKALFRMVLKEN